MSEYTYIDSREELAEFAKRHGLRANWHEPDEQGVSARVVGTNLDNAFGSHGHDFDNAMYTGAEPSSTFSNLFTGHELRVVLEVEGYDDGEAFTEEKAVINLASLLAWAADVDTYAEIFPSHRSIH
jgi:hypothetical protein